MAGTRAEELLEMLQELDGGHSMVELHSAIRETVAAVRSTGKSGSVTIKLQFDPKGAERVTVRDEIKTTTPKPDKMKTLFFVDDDGSLSRSDPNQPELLSIRRVD